MLRTSTMPPHASHTDSAPVVNSHIYEVLGSEAIEFISKYINIESRSTKILETSTRFNVESLEDNSINDFINIKKINQIRYLNKFFESVNNKLPFYGHFVGCVETSEQRKKRILSKSPKALVYPYYSLDFFVKRVLPKMNVTKQIYFILTKGHNRVVSLPETLGRLVSCGFEILDHRESNNLTYFVTQKVAAPSYNMEPSYGPFFRMRRIGKGGKEIYVFKLRTMHPYSEYLQDYVYKMNNLQEGGKFKDDFRITTWGKLFRKLWLDELPMIVNWIIGDLKLVGVRPLSPHYLSLYRPDLKVKRMKYKPGLIPPFYADMPKTLEEIMDSEERYLDAYEKNPVLTDIKYFYKAWFNIFLKRARSA